MIIERPLSFRQVRFKLEALGFRGITQSRNHAKFSRVRGNDVQTAILPHYTELTTSVIASVLRQAGVSAEEFDQV
jgi:hypothetical protein